MSNISKLMALAASNSGAPPGEAIFTTATLSTTTDFTTTFTVPAGVTSISAVAVGGGAGGHPGALFGDINTTSGDGGDGGQGGSLSYAISIPVTPGEILDITVGRAGSTRGNNQSSTATNNPGGHSIISRNGTNLLFARGGDNSVGSIVVGTYNGRGGAGGQESAAVTGGFSGGGGGGGAGGYGTIVAINTTTAQEYASGGAGGQAVSSATNASNGLSAHGAGGGGGGGGAHYTSNSLENQGSFNGLRGGGIGIFGRGTAGIGGVNGRNGSVSQGAAAGNTAGGNGSNGSYGAGGGGGRFRAFHVPSDGEVQYASASGGSSGLAGAIRIIWGEGRAYPETNTAQEFSNEIYINNVLQ